MLVSMVVSTTVFAISAIFWLKTLMHLVHDQVHGAQHIGQHMVGFNF
jgi:hypothetical protein